MVYFWDYYKMHKLAAETTQCEWLEGMLPAVL
jgi:hypothetical protein